MIADGQSGPYSWWESQQFPNPGSPWTGTHPEAGNGSSPHAWGMANANMVLLDSLAAQRADGSLVVGRGVPSSWVATGKLIPPGQLPPTVRTHLGLAIRTSGASVTLSLTGQPRRARAVPAAGVRRQHRARQRGDGRREDRHGHVGRRGPYGLGPAEALGPLMLAR